MRNQAQSFSELNKEAVGHGRLFEATLDNLRAIEFEMVDRRGERSFGSLLNDEAQPHVWVCEFAEPFDMPLWERSWRLDVELRMHQVVAIISNKDLPELGRAVHEAMIDPSDEWNGVGNVPVDFAKIVRRAHGIELIADVLGSALIIDPIKTTAITRGNEFGIEIEVACPMHAIDINGVVSEAESQVDITRRARTFKGSVDALPHRCGDFQHCFVDPGAHGLLRAEFHDGAAWGQDANVKFAANVSDFFGVIAHAALA